MTLCSLLKRRDWSEAGRRAEATPRAEVLNGCISRFSASPLLREKSGVRRSH